MIMIRNKRIAGTDSMPNPLSYPHFSFSIIPQHSHIASHGTKPKRIQSLMGQEMQTDTNNFAISKVDVSSGTNLAVLIGRGDQAQRQSFRAYV